VRRFKATRQSPDRGCYVADRSQSSSQRRQRAQATYSCSVRRRAWRERNVAPPDTEIFKFANGSGIGVSYVNPSQALTPEQHLKAIWLEFEVKDEKTTVAKLEAVGIRPFEYFDKAHKYFQAPGGQVFRLTQQ
jgi:hypothetical protein